jgi:formate hydrogenlyase subunit 4
MTTPVRPPSPADQAWADLAARLTPAASLDRIDTITARAITTITVIGVLLTGLGTVSAGQFTHHGAARDLAIATVITATMAVACALIAQVLTITRHLNPANLAAVQAWYHRQFTIRARTTQAATILLIVAALLSGATAATALL